MEQAQPPKVVASMDYSMCFSPTLPDIREAAMIGHSVDYRHVAYLFV
jgi:hypothetical protein